MKTQSGPPSTEVVGQAGGMVVVRHCDYRDRPKGPHRRLDSSDVEVAANTSAAEASLPEGFGALTEVEAQTLLGLVSTPFVQALLLEQEEADRISDERQAEAAHQTRLANLVFEH